MSGDAARMWPGCHGDGRCRPCGALHDFKRLPTYGPVRHDVCCWQNHEHGCPQPHPDPVHTWDNGRCRQCHVRAQWIAPDGTRFHTIADARRARVPRSTLHREDELSGIHEEAMS